MDGTFHAGYIQGLRDAGYQDLSRSMHDLSRKHHTGSSAGYMQGFRDGTSGVFGDRMSSTLLRRLDEQYAGQDDFKTSYIEGFKDGVANRAHSSTTSKIDQSLSQITERLQTLERSKGDEIHTTKVYHVYNQMPDTAGYAVQGAQLAAELEDVASSSRRSTLRRHYTPGDYMRYASDARYASDTEGYSGSLRRQRRTLSASNVGRGMNENLDISVVWRKHLPPLD